MEYQVVAILTHYTHVLIMFVLYRFACDTGIVCILPNNCVMQDLLNAAGDIRLRRVVS